MEDPPTVLLVDDSDHEADQYKRLLERDRRLRVVVRPPPPALGDYAPLVHDRSVGAVIVDQVLSDAASVDYSGLEVVNYLRAFSDALPVYILTNYYDDDLQESGEAADFVIAKEEIRARGHAYVTRILRRMGQYRAALGERQARYRALVDRAAAGALTAAEAEALAGLRREIERPAAAALAAHDDRARAEAADDARRLAELRAIAERLGAAVPAVLPAAPDGRGESIRVAGVTNPTTERVAGQETKRAKLPVPPVAGPPTDVAHRAGSGARGPAGRRAPRRPGRG